jgi:hypothetical protein
LRRAVRVILIECCTKQDELVEHCTAQCVIPRVNLYHSYTVLTPAPHISLLHWTTLDIRGPQGFKRVTNAGAAITREHTGPLPLPISAIPSAVTLGKSAVASAE